MAQGERAQRLQLRFGAKHRQPEQRNHNQREDDAEDEAEDEFESDTAESGLRPNGQGEERQHEGQGKPVVDTGFDAEGRLLLTHRTCLPTRTAIVEVAGVAASPAARKQRARVAGRPSR